MEITKLYKKKIKNTQDHSNTTENITSKQYVEKPAMEINNSKPIENVSNVIIKEKEKISQEKLR